MFRDVSVKFAAYVRLNDLIFLRYKHTTVMHLIPYFAQMLSTEYCGLIKIMFLPKSPNFTV
jgi:hypothetical protein